MPTTQRTGYGASEPAHGQRIVLAQRLVDGLVRHHGHSRGAAEWAIHRLVESGLLLAEVGVVVERPVVDHPGPALILHVCSRFAELCARS